MDDWRTGLIPLDEPSTASGGDDWKAGLIPLDDGPDYSPGAFDRLSLPKEPSSLPAPKDLIPRLSGGRPAMPGPLPAGPDLAPTRSLMRRAPTGETFSQASIDRQTGMLDVAYAE